MSVTLATFLSILALCIVHIASGARVVQRRRWTPALLSLAAGISVSYVFLDLLPDLVERQEAIDQAGFVQMIDRHVYVFSLLGLIVAFWVEADSCAIAGRPGAVQSPSSSMIDGRPLHMNRAAMPF